MGMVVARHKHFTRQWTAHSRQKLEGFPAGFFDGLGEQSVVRVGSSGGRSGGDWGTTILIRHGVAVVGTRATQRGSPSSRRRVERGAGRASMADLAARVEQGKRLRLHTFPTIMSRVMGAIIIIIRDGMSGDIIGGGCQGGMGGGGVEMVSVGVASGEGKALRRVDIDPVQRLLRSCHHLPTPYHPPYSY